MRRRTVAEADAQAGTVPTIAIGVGEFEDNVASVLEGSGTFNDKATVGIHGEGQRQRLGHGAVGVNDDIEHARGHTRRVDSASVEGVAHKADIGAGRADMGNGIGGHVVTSVLERSHDGEGLARDKTTGTSHAVELQHGFASCDDCFAFPSIAATNSGDLDGESAAIGNTFSNAISETIHLNGGVRIKVVEGTYALDDGQVAVFAGESDVSRAIGGLRTHVLESDAHR